jgi:AcrR family transcriptional regulator
MKMKQDKRELILQAALELFAEQGFRGTSTAQIAKHAGVATGTLFHHFNTKEELINYIYSDIKTRIAENMLQALAENTAIREKMRTVWFVMANWALENKLEYQFKKHCEASPYINDELRDECEAKFHPLFEMFEQAAVDGLIKDLPIDLLGSFLASTMDGFINYLNKHPEDIDNLNLWEKAFTAGWDTIR